MNSYSVSILLRAIYHPDVPSLNRRWMELVYLVPAYSENLARKAAVDLAHDYESSYQTTSGVLIVWKVVGCAGVWVSANVSVNQPMELFSRFLREAEGESLLKPFDD